MKLLFALVTCFVLTFQTADIDTIRQAYPTAGQTQQNAKKFADLTEKVPNTSSTIAAYKAASEIIEAKFAKGTSKISLVKKGIKSLEAVINTVPNAIVTGKQIGRAHV